MILSIITPEKTTVLENMESIVLPGWEGEMEVLEGHIPYLVLLKKGRIKTRAKGKSDTGVFFTEEGLAQVNRDSVNVLTKRFAAQ